MVQALLLTVDTNQAPLHVRTLRFTLPLFVRDFGARSTTTFMVKEMAVSMAVMCILQGVTFMNLAQVGHIQEAVAHKV